MLQAFPDFMSLSNNTDIFRFSGSAETFPEAFWIVVPWYPITKGFPTPNYINDPILDTFWVPHFKTPHSVTVFVIFFN